MRFIFTAFIGIFLISSAVAGEKNQEIIILLGAPASGKGTQAKFITEELKIPHISTGDLFRENIKKNTKLGIEAEKYINQGLLVPDSIVLGMLFDRIALPDAQKGYLLDGFPRTVAQAEIYTKHLGPLVKPLVIYIDVPDDVLLQRIASREKIEGRADDSQEIAAKRLKVYKEHTAPLISYYSSIGELHKIQGNGPIEDTKKQIEVLIQKPITKKPTK